MRSRAAKGRRTSAPPTDPLIEALAAIEHEQWSQWAQAMLSGITASDRRRWRRQVATPYSDLSESEKEQDRIFARRVLAEVARHLSARAGDATVLIKPKEDS